MKYSEWFEEFASRHGAIVETLSHFSQDKLIDYFDYEHMRVAHPDFCPLYSKDQKCHDIKDLNCYFCACMHFRFSDEGIDNAGGKRVYSYCGIDSDDSRLFEDITSIHNDCSKCEIPHKKYIIKKYFLRDWREIMRDCSLSS